MAFIAATANDHGMNLPNAQTVWWTGKFWSRNRDLAQRYKSRETVMLAMHGFKLNLEEVN